MRSRVPFQRRTVQPIHAITNTAINGTIKALLDTAAPNIQISQVIDRTKATTRRHHNPVNAYIGQTP